MLPRLRARLERPIDAASFAAFRIMLGAVLALALVRSLQKGVVEQAFIAPELFFPGYGFGFLPPPGRLAYALYGVLALAAACIALGLFTRLAAACFCLLFTYLHFVDLTNYLNHYYLISLLTGLLTLVPNGNVAALSGTPSALPSWVLFLFRFQLGVVYFFGGVAKLKSDWLLRGEPLGTWLAANTDLPVLGPLFRFGAAAYLVSWLGALYDLSIPFALTYRRTRPYAYVFVVVFHLLTARLFQIGVFPYLMIVGSLLFLDPSWPRRLLRRPVPRASSLPPRSAAPLAALALYALVQLLMPLRHWLYPGDVLWTEQGYRFAWNVMLIEKTGAARFRVQDRATHRTRTVLPSSLLTRAQTKAMATQPDLILAFAHELARRERAQGHEVAVYADVFAVLNGRAPARLIDPTVDLSRQRDTFAPKAWIVPRAPAPPRRR